MIHLIKARLSLPSEVKPLVQLARDEVERVKYNPKLKDVEPNVIFRRIHYNLLRAKFGKQEANRIYDPLR